MNYAKWLLSSLVIALAMTSCEDVLEDNFSPIETFNFTLDSEEILLTPCDEGVDMEPGNLPAPIQAFLAENYPDLGITEIEEYEGGFIEVEVAGDLHLYFDDTGMVMGIDEEEEDNAAALEQLLAQAKEYLRSNERALLNLIDEAELQYMFGQLFLEIEFKNDGEMIFDSNGQLLCAYDDRDRMDKDDESDEEEIDPADLPQTIIDYLAENYPGVDIDEVEYDDDGYYEVELDNGVELYFDEDGNLIGMDDDDEEDEGDEEEIDPADLPQTIIDYLAENYPGVDIDEVEYDDDGYYEVELDNGVELYFDEDGNLIGMDDDDEEDEGDEENIDPADLPQTIIDYLAENYPGVDIDEVEYDDDGYYEVELDNGVELYFDEDGNLIGMDDEDDDQTQDDREVTPNQLPRPITNYITNNYPGASIDKAYRNPTGGYYMIVLNNGIVLYFSLGGEFLGTDRPDDDGSDDSHDDEGEDDDSDDDEGEDDDSDDDEGEGDDSDDDEGEDDDSDDDEGEGDDSDDDEGEDDDSDDDEGEDDDSDDDE